MPTKRFVWKDRDTAALDLIQLAYHAPEFISQAALHILSAIHSEVIVTDLCAITLDSEREYWERVCAVRALTCTSGDIYFPELGNIDEADLLNRHDIISQSTVDLEKVHEVYVRNDLLMDTSNKNVSINRRAVMPHKIGLKRGVY